MKLIDADALDRDTLGDVAEYIDSVPAVDPVKHGHWIIRDHYFWHCSECWVTSTDHSLFCCNCGSKMDGGIEC